MPELITETDELTRLEAMVEQFRGSFVAAGQALRAIRDQRLYREQFVTFEEYCRARWGMERAFAHRLIAAAEVIEQIRMSPIGDIRIPTCESQARELTLLDDPSDRLAAWSAVLEAAGDKAVTAKMVRDQVNAILPPKPDDPIIPALEFEAIKKWLVSRRDSWPAEYQHTFTGFVTRILEQMEPTDVHDRGEGADPAIPDQSAA